MTQTLYNCKSVDETHYRITKFDSGLVPFEDDKGRISSYTCSLQECECPAGHKPTCRHRKMLPLFLENDHIDDNYFFIWDTHQWFKATGIFAEAAREILDPMVTPDPFVIEEGSPKDASAVPS